MKKRSGRIYLRWIYGDLDFGFSVGFTFFFDRGTDDGATSKLYKFDGPFISAAILGRPVGKSCFLVLGI